MMPLLTLAAILFSAGLILLLGLGDPKRRRAARKGAGQGATSRRLIAVAALLPGLAFLLSGDAAALLLWLGGAAVAGWAVTLVLAARSDLKD
ncbi:hypothetical protein J3E64_001103 [Sphingobium sp. OAS761]|uniref:hypothetical protein n=1 Tax=Sphingobium sp. OAS761 TaxID=2817901 RepID=UPI00209CFA71|nr:hypothetical protein [Sphingobium sp. OAS761]MCP1469428.1 hypothetical protein [Sphingobium sp. OAS761]